MKTVIVALLVSLVISQGHSLKCKCAGPARPCDSPVETCRDSQPFCGNVQLTSNLFAAGFFFQGCMEAVECRGLDNLFKTTCCTTDLCNAHLGVLQGV